MTDQADVTVPSPVDRALLEALHVVCAWCKKVLHQGEPNAPTSRGICVDCLPKLKAAAAEVNEDGEVEYSA